MGMMKAPEKCFITDYPTNNIFSGFDVIEYNVDYNDHVYTFAFPIAYKNSDFVERNKYILKGLIINGKFPYHRDKPYYDEKILEKIINEAQIPQTPKDKLDSLILYLFENQDFSGQLINIRKKSNWDLTLNKLYFKNHKEYWFYMNTLKEKGLVSFIEASDLEGSDAIDIKLTFQGLEYVVNLQEFGEKSKNCFIAMSFSDTTTKIRDTIKKAIRESGYEPLLVDELNYDSDLSINDAIIKYIKRSKFLIADFTEQKHGVYFEAGFALGLKRPVIYTCSQKDFEKSHYDTNHYPHIVYTDLDDLLIRLKNKIQAWIE